MSLPAAQRDQRLLEALPALLVVAGESWENPLVAYLAEEIVKDEPGQEAMLDRLLDLLLIGYGSPFALSTAFKRVRGISPREHRAAA